MFGKVVINHTSIFMSTIAPAAADDIRTVVSLGDRVIRLPIGDSIPGPLITQACTLVMLMSLLSMYRNLLVSPERSFLSTSFQQFPIFVYLSGWVTEQSD